MRPAQPAARSKRLPRLRDTLSFPAVIVIFLAVVS